MKVPPESLPEKLPPQSARPTPAERAMALRRSGLAPAERLAVALDTDDWDRFCAWAELFGPRVGFLKVGLEAYVRWGPRAAEVARSAGRGLFLDLKLHDIPNTVAATVKSARALEADLLTVHVSGGRDMLGAAVDAASGAVGILGVTLLTHLEPPALLELAMPGEVHERVLKWADLAAAAGCWGVVCSPLEARDLRSRSGALRLVTPGIRPAALEGSPASRSPLADDQRRTATPAEALAAGADLLVVGRPLTRAPQPLEALDQLLEGLEGLEGLEARSGLDDAGAAQPDQK